MNPREPMLGGGDGDEPVGSQNFLVAVEGVETVHEGREGVKVRRGVPPHVHHEVAQVPRLNAIRLAALRLGPVQRFGEPVVKLPVQPADKLGPANVRRRAREPLLHELLDSNVRQTELLVVALGLIVREVPPHRPLDVARRGLVALDEIRVVAVHLPDEVGHPLEDVGRVNLPGEATGGFQDFTGQLGQAGASLLGQERLHGCRVPICFHVTQIRKCLRKS